MLQSTRDSVLGAKRRHGIGLKSGYYLALLSCPEWQLSLSLYWGSGRTTGKHGDFVSIRNICPLKGTVSVTGQVGPLECVFCNEITLRWSLVVPCQFFVYNTRG